jgi:hypothetical protein
LGAQQDLISVIATAWKFEGLAPRAIVDVNAFGNVLVEDVDGTVWKICPEELSCDVVAETREELQELQEDEDFVEDWKMTELVELATSALGPAPKGKCFCLKVPAVLGGEYGEENLATISVAELLAVSGDIARQVKDLPDGAHVELKVVG